MIFLTAKMQDQTVHCKFFIVTKVQHSVLLAKDFLHDHRAILQFGSDGTMRISIHPGRQVLAGFTVTVLPKAQVAMIACIKGKPIPNQVVGLTFGSPI